MRDSKAFIYFMCAVSAMGGLLFGYDWTIGQLQGQYKGMLMERHFTVVLPDGTSKTVGYSGNEAAVTF